MIPDDPEAKLSALVLGVLFLLAGLGGVVCVILGGK